VAALRSKRGIVLDQSDGKIPTLTVAGSVRVRQAAAEDGPSIGNLCRQLGYEPSPEDVAQTLWQQDPDRHCVFVAETEEVLVGWIEATIESHLSSGREAMIGGLVVEAGYRGRGIGELLVRTVESLARTQGVASIRVRSRVERTDAHRFYARLGYVESKRQAVFHKGIEPSPSDPP
jgi:GNAT superfamily N-acetyltransferase